MNYLLVPPVVELSKMGERDRPQDGNCVILIYGELLSISRIYFIPQGLLPCCIGPVWQVATTLFVAVLAKLSDAASRASGDGGADHRLFVTSKISQSSGAPRVHDVSNRVKPKESQEPPSGQRSSDTTTSRPFSPYLTESL